MSIDEIKSIIKEKGYYTTEDEGIAHSFDQDDSYVVTKMGGEYRIEEDERLQDESLNEYFYEGDDTVQAPVDEAMAANEFHIGKVSSYLMYYNSEHGITDEYQKGAPECFVVASEENVRNGNWKAQFANLPVADRTYRFSAASKGCLGGKISGSIWAQNIVDSNDAPRLDHYYKWVYEDFYMIIDGKEVHPFKENM